MAPTADHVRTLDDLRRFVHDTLCMKENLLADQFSMTELRMTRNGRVCGLQFCLRGPRSVRLAALWAADHNTVYFYDAKGTRYAKRSLAHRLAFERSSSVARSQAEALPAA